MKEKAEKEKRTGMSRRGLFRNMYVYIFFFLLVRPTNAHRHRNIIIVSEFYQLSIVSNSFPNDIWPVGFTILTVGRTQ